MHIEIFPAEKSCEQGCPTCPLARKDKKITAVTIDSEVQKSFSILEAELKKRNIKYNLHITSSLHLFPSLAHPELVHMSRFETSKEIRLNGNAMHFSDNIYQVLKTYSINPSIVAFSIVPEFPVLSDADVDVVREMVNAIKVWHFTSRAKEIEVTIRTNLIKMPLFEEVLPQLFSNDLMRLGNLMGEYTKSSVHRTFVSDQVGGYVYNQIHKGTINGKKISIGNRVIGSQKMIHSERANIKQAFTSEPDSLDGIDFAIAPKGVMLMHSSLSINNPVLWVSHEDFRASLQREAANARFSMLRFVRKMIIQNAVMYKYIWKLCKEDRLEMLKQDFLESYQQIRPSLPKVK